MRYRFYFCSVVLILSFGGASLAFLPPFLTGDASGHWGRTVQIAQGGLIAEHLGPNAWGGPIDARSVTFIWKILPYFLKGEPFRFKDVQIASEVADAEPALPAIHNFPNAAAFPPLAYLPQAFGYAIAQSLHLPLYQSYYAASLTNLICYVLLVLASMLLLPTFRQTILAVALLPTAIIQAASVSGDALNNMYPILFLAAAYRLRSSLILLMSIGLALLKPTAIFYGFTVLPRHRIVVLLPSAVIALAWIYFHRFNPAEYYKTGGDAKIQLFNIASFPVEMLNSFARFGNIIVQQFFGQFGGIAGPYVYLPNVWLAAIAVALILPIAMSEGAAAQERRWVGYLHLAVGALNIILIIFLFWLVFTAPALSWIEGFQGRYFIAPVAICLIGFGIAVPRRIRSAPLILATCVALNMIGLVSGLAHYHQLYDVSVWK